MLTPEAREEISGGVAEGLEAKQLAAGIGRCPRVLSLAVARLGGRAGYRGHRAGAGAHTSRRRPKLRRLDADAALRQLVLAGLRTGWSPRQPSGRLRVEYTGDQTMWVSHEAIYTWLYALPKGELKPLAEQQIRLRTGRTTRRPATGRKPRQARITGMRMIDERPAEATGRQVPGHWEGDLVIGKDGKSAVATLVERVSRFAVLVALPARDARTVAEALIDSVGDLPTLVRQSLTWDCGSEMAQHAAITLATDMPVFFAHPHSPWERGTNEPPTDGYGSICRAAPLSPTTRPTSTPSPLNSTTSHGLSSTSSNHQKYSPRTF